MAWYGCPFFAERTQKSNRKGTQRTFNNAARFWMLSSIHLWIAKDKPKVDARKSYKDSSRHVMEADEYRPTMSNRMTQMDGEVPRSLPDKLASKGPGFP